MQEREGWRPNTFPLNIRVADDGFTIAGIRSNTLPAGIYDCRLSIDDVRFAKSGRFRVEIEENATAEAVLDATEDPRQIRLTHAIEEVASSTHIPDARLAVRSSAVGEDSADASFAGQHTTKLNVGKTSIPDAVQVVWASARTDSALAYRSRRGLPSEPKIAAVVQMLIEPIAAGVQNRPAAPTTDRRRPT